MTKMFASKETSWASTSSARTVDKDRYFIKN